MQTSKTAGVLKSDGWLQFTHSPGGWAVSCLEEAAPERHSLKARKTACVSDWRRTSVCLCSSCPLCCACFSRSHVHAFAQAVLGLLTLFSMASKAPWTLIKSQKMTASLEPSLLSAQCPFCPQCMNRTRHIFNVRSKSRDM